MTDARDEGLKRETQRPRRGSVIRHVLLSLERIVAAEAASGVVRGAAEEIKEQFPELDEELRGLFTDLLVVVRRTVQNAARGEGASLEGLIEKATEAGMRGALDELDRQWADGGLPFHGLSERLNLALDRISDFAESRAERIRNPAGHARTIAESVVEGAAYKFHETLPQMQDELRSLLPVAREAAREMGEGFTEGLASGGTEHRQVLVETLEAAGAAMVRGLMSGFIDSAEQGTRAAERAGRALLPVAAVGAETIARGITVAVIDELCGALARGGRRLLSPFKLLSGSTASSRLAVARAGSVGAVALGAFLLGRRAAR